MGSEDTQFQPGESGNPAGRPKGARSKLSEAFISALSEDFETNGLATVEKVREEKPDAYLNVIGKLMPKLMELTGPEGGPIDAKMTMEFVDAPTGPEEV